MILKRTKSIRKTAAAVAWISQYVDEVEKHKEKDLRQMGLGLGKRYFSTRPPGLLSAHGYIRETVAEIRKQFLSESGDAKPADRAPGLQNNLAIQEFVRRHGRAQREKNRKIVALRLIASLDPHYVEPILQYPVDLDRLLIAAIERTLGWVAEKHYPGDELGYIVGLHHDALDRSGRPHLHAHIFLLPQTRTGVRISVSNHSRPGRDGQYVDMLTETKDLFREAATDLVYATAPARYRRFASQDWDDLAREISLKTVETAASGRPMSAERTRQYALSTFFFYVRKTHPDWLKRRLQHLKDRIATLSSRDTTSLLAAAGKLYVGLKTLMQPKFEDRRHLARQILPTFQNERVLCETRICQLKETRTSLLAWRTVGNRRKRIERLMQEFNERRMAARTSMLGELSLIDLYLAAAGLATNPPAWMQRLEIGARGERLANRDLIDAPSGGSAAEMPPEPEVSAEPVMATPVPGSSPASSPGAMPVKLSNDEPTRLAAGGRVF